jgi:septum site-determining protein MinC
MPKSMHALELKGRTLSLTRVRVLNADPAAIDAQLRELARQMPQAAQGMPVLVEAALEFDLPALVQQLRAVGMQPVGVVDGVVNEQARCMGLAILPAVLPMRSPRSEAAVTPGAAETVVEKTEPVVTTTAAVRRPTRIVDRPVRSGQQIYAEGADLIVTGAISAGAEVIADGCVHVYGPLRGRVIAGARGDNEARVFCRKLEAELVAVAGVYSVAEQMNGLRGHAAQAFLDGGKLRIELLN